MFTADYRIMKERTGLKRGKNAGQGSFSSYYSIKYVVVRNDVFVVLLIYACCFFVNVEFFYCIQTTPFLS
jgi:hypothetical protein